VGLEDSAPPYEDRPIQPPSPPLNSLTMLTLLGDKLNYVGAQVTNNLNGFGQFTLFALDAWHWFWHAPAKWLRGYLILPQMFQMGTRSVPVVMLVGAFVGMVLSVETFAQFAAIGQETRLGGVIDISVVKQIGPVLAAVMLAGRVGGSVSAELGTMRVTEQIDAMRSMGADPIAYLVVPRVVACVVMIPILTIFSNLMGIAGAYMVNVWGHGVDPIAYRQFSASFVTRFDVITGLCKATCFGLAIALISCYKGFNCRPGAEGVGRAATDSFVTSFIAIIVVNFFLAKFIRDLYSFLYGEYLGSAFG